MNTLIIYDATGYILFQGSGAVREPIGIPFLWIEIPIGKRIKLTDGIGVNISVTPNIAILEDIPLTDLQILQASQDTTNEAITELSMIIGGMM